MCSEGGLMPPRVSPARYAYQSDGTAEGDLPHEQAVHPAKGKLDVLDHVLLQVDMQRRVYPGHQLLHALDVLLDARLRKRVVVL